MARQFRTAESKRLQFPYNVHWKCGIMIQRPVGFLTMPEVLKVLGRSEDRFRKYLYTMMTPTCAINHALYSGWHTHFIKFMPWPCLEFVKRVDMVQGHQKTRVAPRTRLPRAVPIQEIRHASTIPTLGALMFTLWALEVNTRHAIALGQMGGLPMAEATETAAKLAAARQRIVTTLIDSVPPVQNGRRVWITTDPVRVKEIWRLSHKGLAKKTDGQ